ncbi:MAG: restriction endonuclease subunit S [Bacteroidales bacterium]|nr:restriction endonuclease subunit S [Bacteroidales bacterium]
MVVQSQFIEMFGDTFQNERGWTFKKLPEVSTIVLGSTPSSSNVAFWDGDVKWITPAELSDDSFYLYDSERHITEEGVKSTSLKPFPAGTVILSTRAPIGKTAIAGCEMYCNQGFKNFVCDNTINSVYLFFTLRIHNPELQKMGTGSTFLELSKKAIEQISISVPPKELQDEFEQFYKQADKSKFDGLKSQFIEMFSCALQRKLSDVANITMGASPDSNYYNTTNSGLPFYQGKTEFGDMYIGKATLYCSEPIRIAQPNDILMSVRAPVGTVNITKEECCIGRGLASIRPNGVEQLFLYYALKLKEKDLDALGTGTTFKAINKDMLYEFSIEVGTIDKQKVFVEIAQQADKSKYLS